MHPVCQETPKSHQLLISLLNQTTVSIVGGVTSFQHLPLISQIVCSYVNCKLDHQFQDFEINSSLCFLHHSAIVRKSGRYHDLRHCLTTVSLKSGDVKLMTSRRSSFMQTRFYDNSKVMKLIESFLRLETRPGDPVFKFVSLNVLQN